MWEAQVSKQFTTNGKKKRQWIKMIFWLKLIFDMIWNVKSKCNRMTLKLWWHKFNYMSKHTHMLLWETEQNMHLDVDFMLPDFIHAPQMDFLWTGQSGGPPTVWDQGLKYLLAVYKEKKKNSTAISHRVRRQEGWTDQTGDEQRSTCNPATSSPVNEPEESGLWRNCPKQWITLSINHMYSE